MRLRILVAEDEPFLLEITQAILEHAGHEVLVATNGSDALRLAREEEPDVALIDIMMPELDGREVTRRIREDDSLDGLRIALYSSLPEPESRWRSSGADAFRSKTADVRGLPGFLEELAA
jgi:CheY-like chemotaxis protein